jgi:DNA-directed RNA polymerase subunit K/omega
VQPQSAGSAKRSPYFKRGLSAQIADFSCRQLKSAVKTYPSVEDDKMKYTDLVSQAVNKMGSYFLLCNVLSQRIKQLENGALPKVESDIYEYTPKIEIALKEIIEGKVGFSRPPEGM